MGRDILTDSNRRGLGGLENSLRRAGQIGGLEMSMTGQHYVVRNEDQRGNALRQLQEFHLPFQVKTSAIHLPKTSKQVRYAHSLCNALAAYAQSSPEHAKADAKREYGVILVCQSIVTGDRSARLVSFADYKRDEMAGFIASMEAHLSENNIPFTPAAEVK